MLRILPSSISNLIAAGEVVQRPASAVKELMENAVDAGASNISVIIEDAGKTLIQVIDDGCGMTPDEARLCFERHATSKIAEASDLSSIMTYGFRGEALPSIAAVAEVTLRTRKKGSETGSETIFSPDGFVSQEEDAMPEGTNIAIRNIFYSLPARRKFLKSDSTEFRQILSEFSHVALCRPEIGVKLTHNGKDLYNLKKANTLKQRILEIEGKDMAKELIDISTSTSIITISGFVGNPEDARKSAGNQFFFVNGRYFRSSYFHKAVMKAYDKLIPEGAYPSYYIFFKTGPENVDVNIHPSKTEVKFENETEIFEILTAVVKESLGRNSFIPTIDFDHDTLPDIPAPSHFNYTGSYSRPGQVKHVRYDSILPDFKPSDTSVKQTQPIVSGYNRIFEDSGTGSSGTMQISGRYLATTLRSGLMIVDIKRARERIFYERYLRQLDNMTPVSQQILFPCEVRLSQERYSLLMENAGKLRQLGFGIEPAGDCTVEVRGLPEGFGTDGESAEEAIDSLLAVLAETGSIDLMKAEAREETARKLARSAACSCHDERLTDDEARLLVDTLFSCAEPETSPSGRKCMSVLTDEDIERLL
ncbi:MAG TPA: DNA mismatch repair endonuclease MutL [Candidatus Coprenecus stercoravium]|uniref:DNA mismatch repair protein MutL n=1 Tax=Candidatus Coprenecus stercoravium TaxID=2840735 RepID=A0A9D2GRP0_9BACT|nr:DNA mismatch repair endonuclease MutL [Candidatus Coprenecus stercoravium]